MVSYNVVISPKALSQLNDYIDYIQYTLFNSQAAEAVWSDALETTVRLETIAGSLQPCSHPKLKEYGYYPILFTDHNYVMLYRIIGHTVYVEAIYHQLQDYQNIFAKDIK